MRRGEILDVAQSLVQTRGYEQMSIQDVLSELDMSKGALYHYFRSKQDLLAGIVDRMADQVRARLASVAEDPHLDALDKLNQIFQALAGWKVQRRDQLIALLRAWCSDGNALMRQKARAGITDRLAPLFELVIEQGVEDGSFTLSVDVGFGRVLVSLIHELNDRLGDLFLAHEAGTSDPAAIEQNVAAYTTAVERILGVAEGSVTLVDLTVLRAWFDPH
ncbi:TetR/AcrR family transcriptional regulator [Actinopolymorpha pittospori]